MPNFPKNEHFLPPDTHTHVYSNKFLRRFQRGESAQAIKNLRFYYTERFCYVTYVVRVNLHSVILWMSWNALLETAALSEI